jgi:hypothetical protein
MRGLGLTVEREALKVLVATSTRSAVLYTHGPVSRNCSRVVQLVVIAISRRVSV